MKILSKKKQEISYKGSYKQDRLSLPAIFFDSSKFDKGVALYFHSFSSRSDRDSEDFASLFLRDILSDYRQNNPFKHNAPPFICYRIRLRQTEAAQVNPAYLMLYNGTPDIVPNINWDPQNLQHKFLISS
jgi:hypothetical protein